MHIIADWKRTNCQCYALRPHVSDTAMRCFLEALARRHSAVCLFLVASILMCTYSHGTQLGQNPAFKYMLQTNGPGTTDVSTLRYMYFLIGFSGDR